MQLKGLVTVFAIALIAISLYQLHFTWVVHNHEVKWRLKPAYWANAGYAGASQETSDSTYNRSLKVIDSTKTKVITYGTGPVSYEKAKEQELSLRLTFRAG